MPICRIATIFSIAILLGNSVTLRAAITGPVSTGGDDPAAPVCQMCCQGPAAVPGIPGLPGQPGREGSKGDSGLPGQNGEMGLNGPMGKPGAPGNPGPKGDDGTGLPGKMGPRGPPGLIGPTGETGVKGQKGNTGQNGPKGEPGAAGNPGPKGDDGIGLPGEMGPRGPPGLVSPTGETGVKGQKGEPGGTPLNPVASSNPLVAFTVTRRSDSDTSSDFSAHLPFEETVTLLPGTTFDLGSGTFTCNTPGTYMFMFSVLAYTTNNIFIYLRKNNSVVVTGYNGSSSGLQQVSNGAVLVLERGDTVHLSMLGGLHDNGNHYTSFSGFLLR